MGLFDFGDKVKAARKAAERKNLRTLLRLAQDESYAAQIIALKGLGDAGDVSAVSALLPRLQDPEFEVRAAAAEALGKLGDSEVRARLLECLRTEKNDFVRQTITAAVKALS